ncbi:GYF domain-containing protein mpd2 [Pseudohyphozyma bogoriensis]|nr:GYF domain-containing protein mpd2 [Pseudohyphozyma bogoriensis]
MVRGHWPTLTPQEEKTLENLPWTPFMNFFLAGGRIATDEFDQLFTSSLPHIADNRLKTDLIDLCLSFKGILEAEGEAKYNALMRDRRRQFTVIQWCNKFDSEFMTAERIASDKKHLSNVVRRTKETCSKLKLPVDVLESSVFKSDPVKALERCFMLEGLFSETGKTRQRHAFFTRVQERVQSGASLDEYIEVAKTLFCEEFLERLEEAAAAERAASTPARPPATRRPPKIVPSAPYSNPSQAMTQPHHSESESEYEPDDVAHFQQAPSVLENRARREREKQAAHLKSERKREFRRQLKEQRRLKHEKTFQIKQALNYQLQRVQTRGPRDIDVALARIRHQLTEVMTEQLQYHFHAAAYQAQEVAAQHQHIADQQYYNAQQHYANQQLLAQQQAMYQPYAHPSEYYQDAHQHHQSYQPYQEYLVPDSGGYYHDDPLPPAWGGDSTTMASSQGHASEQQEEEEQLEPLHEMGAKVVECEEQERQLNEKYVHCLSSSAYAQVNDISQASGVDRNFGAGGRTKSRWPTSRRFFLAGSLSAKSALDQRSA